MLDGEHLIRLAVFPRNHPAENKQILQVTVTTLTSCIPWRFGAAMKTTNGEYSAVRNTFKACGSTSRIAIFPLLWMFRMVSNLVPYMPEQTIGIWSNYLEPTLFMCTVLQIFIILNIRHHLLVGHKVVVLSINFIFPWWPCGIWKPQMKNVNISGSFSRGIG